MEWPSTELRQTGSQVFHALCAPVSVPETFYKVVPNLVSYFKKFKFLKNLNLEFVDNLNSELLIKFILIKENERTAPIYDYAKLARISLLKWMYLPLNSRNNNAIRW